MKLRFKLSVTLEFQERRFSTNKSYWSHKKILAKWKTRQGRRTNRLTLIKTYSSQRDSRKAQKSVKLDSWNFHSKICATISTHSRKLSFPLRCSATVRIKLITSSFRKGFHNWTKPLACKKAFLGAAVTLIWMWPHVTWLNSTLWRGISTSSLARIFSSLHLLPRLPRCGRRIWPSAKNLLGSRRCIQTYQLKAQRYRKWRIQPSWEICYKRGTRTRSSNTKRGSMAASPK